VLTPLESLNVAEGIAARIPRTLEYSEERNAAWLAVGTAHLYLDDIENARKALQGLDDVRDQASLRLEAGKWAGEHEDSETGHDLLLDTVSQISTFERWLSRKDVTDLVPAVYKVIGAEAVLSMARQLEDPFTAGNVYVVLAGQLPTLEARREQLLNAEKLAVGVREGDRDWALRWVFRGYQNAALRDDAERIRQLASIDPDELTREETTLFARTNELLPEDPPDTPLARLRRFLDYKFNDLKVIFLTDMCRGGSIDDPEMEELIRSESFQRVEGARPPRLGADTSSLDAAGMARFLFGRPVRQHEVDRRLLEGEDLRDDGPEGAIFVRQLSGLFREFGRLAEPFSAEQVEQGLWFTFGHPFSLGEMLNDPEIALQIREDCLRAMVNPFRDYYLPREGRFSGSAFYMWWDLLLVGQGEEELTEFGTIALDVLRQILELPGKECQFAALHGLNHMHPNSVAVAMVQKYLEGHSESLTAAEHGWVQSCASGTAL